MGIVTVKSSLLFPLVLFAALLESSDIATAEMNNDGGTRAGHTCFWKSTDNDPVTTVHELSRFMTKYVAACNADLFVIDHIFISERRTEWATTIETKLDKIAEVVDDLKISRECRESLCRLDIQTSSRTRPYASIESFNDQVRQLLGAGNIDVGVIQASTKNGIREYLYSESLPPAFLEPLRSELKRLAPN